MGEAGSRIGGNFGGLCIPVGQCHFENINENEEGQALSIGSYNGTAVLPLLLD